VAKPLRYRGVPPFQGKEAQLRLLLAKNETGAEMSSGAYPLQVRVHQIGNRAVIPVLQLEHGIDDENFIIDAVQNLIHGAVALRRRCFFLHG
jgi:hypothetical protein